MPGADAVSSNGYGCINAPYVINITGPANATGQHAMNHGDLREVDLGTTYRVARLVWLLRDGSPVTAREVADLLDISWQGAYLMLSRISLAIPMYCEKKNGGPVLWRILEDDQ